jgi:hypothetical protein
VDNLKKAVKEVFDHVAAVSLVLRKVSESFWCGLMSSDIREAIPTYSFF